MIVIQLHCLRLEPKVIPTSLQKVTWLYSAARPRGVCIVGPVRVMHAAVGLEPHLQRQCVLPSKGQTVRVSICAKMELFLPSVLRCSLVSDSPTSKAVFSLKMSGTLIFLRGFGVQTELCAALGKVVVA